MPEFDSNTQRQLEDIKTREEIVALKNRLDKWEAIDVGHSLWAAWPFGGPFSVGKSPEEAVANLWVVDEILKNQPNG